MILTEILRSFPPNIKRIYEAMPHVKSSKNVIFAYAPNIHAPYDGNLPDYLVKHEECHIMQQGNNPNAWWEKYFSDIKFRFEQEFQAHVIEARKRLETSGGGRSARRKIIAQTVKRLRNPLYGMKSSKSDIEMRLKRELFDG